MRSNTAPTSSKTVALSNLLSLVYRVIVHQYCFMISSFFVLCVKLINVVRCIMLMCICIFEMMKFRFETEYDQYIIA